MKRIILLLLVLGAFSSCRVFNPSQMLRTGHHYKFSDIPTNNTSEEYKIAPNDEISFKLFTNDGEKIIDPTGENSAASSASQSSTISYLVEFDGKVKLPVLGRVQISGMTLREAEKMLEDKYTLYFNKPFVQLKVTNNRVIIFPGGQGGSAKVLTLLNTNTTLLEAIALAGGITDGKAHRVKLIRGTAQNPQIYLIDLSSIDGYKQGNIILQANDIIYIDSRDRVAQKILESITPYLTLLSSALLIYSIFK